MKPWLAMESILQTIVIEMYIRQNFIFITKYCPVYAENQNLVNFHRKHEIIQWKFYLLSWVLTEVMYTLTKSELIHISIGELELDSKFCVAISVWNTRVSFRTRRCGYFPLLRKFLGVVVLKFLRLKSFCKNWRLIERWPDYEWLNAMWNWFSKTASHFMRSIKRALMHQKFLAWALVKKTI